MGSGSSYILREGFAARSHIVDHDRPLILTFHFAKNIPTRDDFLSGKDDIFGYNFLKKNGHNVISITPIGINSWYRDAELFEFLQNLDLTDFKVRLGYGSSMGGYGVGTFSHILGISRVLLLNPISTLQKDIAPFEKRFRRIDSKWEGPFNDASVCRSEGVLFYDPSCVEDSFHARRFSGSNDKVRLIRIIGAGHNVPRVLRDTGRLTKVVNNFISGDDIDGNADRTFRDTDYHNNNLLASGRMTEQRSRVVSARKANLAYQNGQFLSSFRKVEIGRIEIAAKALIDAGKIEEALILYEQLTKIAPSIKKYRLVLNELQARK